MADEKLNRRWVARGFTLVEDVVYVGLGVRVLTVLIIVQVVSLFILRKRGVGKVIAERAT